MTEVPQGADAIPQLNDLADFRHQLRLFLSFSEGASEACGVASQQYQLMQVIGSAPAGQAASITYIADRMVLRHNSTVELVDRAERAGLVARRNDEQDQRRSLVQLTPLGWAQLQRLVAMHLTELRSSGDAIVQTLRAVQRVAPPAATGRTSAKPQNGSPDAGNG